MDLGISRKAKPQEVRTQSMLRKERKHKKNLTMFAKRVCSRPKKNANYDASRISNLIRFHHDKEKERAAIRSLRPGASYQ